LKATLKLKNCKKHVDDMDLLPARKEALQPSEFLIMWLPETPIVNTLRESTGASEDTDPL
jgi:hypothetical protein